MVIHPEAIRLIADQGVWEINDFLDAAHCKNLALALRQAEGSGALRGSHHFGGRYENLYWDHDRPRLLEQLLAELRTAAASVLARPAEGLRIGGWFNLAQPGQATGLHAHEEDDELLSAVVYLQTAPHCGDLQIELDDRPLRIAPRVGAAVFFRPQMLHAVAENHSTSDRLSYAANIGPAASPVD